MFSQPGLDSRYSPVKSICTSCQKDDSHWLDSTALSLVWIAWNIVLSIGAKFKLFSWKNDFKEAKNWKLSDLSSTFSNDSPQSYRISYSCISSGLLSSSSMILSNSLGTAKCISMAKYLKLYRQSLLLNLYILLSRWWPLWKFWNHSNKKSFVTLASSSSSLGGSWAGPIPEFKTSIAI